MIALSEWGLTPEYINEHWTEELLAIMMAARSRWTRRQRGLAPRAVTAEEKRKEASKNHFKSLFKKRTTVRVTGKMDPNNG